ncbi:hypothetical protein L7F22_023401 [Adiantum nelumboides]|nr:hypothetical protein [Adiantum nelumboides]
MSKYLLQTLQDINTPQGNITLKIADAQKWMNKVRIDLEDKAKTFTQALVNEAIVSYMGDLDNKSDYDENANDDDDKEDEDNEEPTGTSGHQGPDDDDNDDTYLPGTGPSSRGTSIAPPPPPPTSQPDPQLPQENDILINYFELMHDPLALLYAMRMEETELPRFYPVLYQGPHSERADQMKYMQIVEEITEWWEKSEGLWKEWTTMINAMEEKKIVKEFRAAVGEFRAGMSSGSLKLVTNSVLVLVTDLRKLVSTRDNSRNCSGIRDSSSRQIFVIRDSSLVTDHEHIESASVYIGTYYPSTLGFGPLAGTEGSTTQDPHIAASDSSSNFDIMERYPMQQHPESSSQDMHALGQQLGAGVFNQLKETLSRATRSKQATNKINKGGGEVDSPFTSQIDIVLPESAHVSTPTTTPIGSLKLTPSETLLLDGRSLAEVQEVECYILAAREKEIESLRKAEQR